jgi:hypothetical protein
VSGNTFDPAAAGVGTWTITYSYTDPNGCSNSASTDITVNPLPEVSCSPLGPLCVNGDVVELATLVNPPGGTFAGPGVSGTTFDPGAAGVGTYTIVYTYTDGNGCSNSCDMSVEVRPLPDFEIQGPTETCIGTPVDLCGPEGDYSYMWVGPGGFVSSDRCVSVSAAGAYTLVVTDLVGKCASAPKTLNLTTVDCEGACPRTPGFWSHECTESTSPTASDNLCDSGVGKPRALIFIYTGLGCDATHDAMDPGKVTCTGDPLMASTVRIHVSDKSNPYDSGGHVYFDGNVNLGGAFTADAMNAGQTRFPASTFAFVFDLSGNLLQSIGFHTSCSQPIQDGDQYGTLLLTGYVGESQPVVVVNPEDYVIESQLPTEVFGGAKLTPEQLTMIAECVNGKVDIFDWAPGTEVANFCATEKPDKPMTPRKQAKRQFAALLANNCAGELGIIANNGDVIELGLNTVVTCKDLLGNDTPITIGELIPLVDAQLIALEPQSLEDKTVKQQYDKTIKCLTAINEGKSMKKTCKSKSGGGDLCSQLGKPRGITFMYTGLDCSASNNSQAAGKVACTGDPAAATPVRILSSNSADPTDGSANVWFDGIVNLGETFTADAANAGQTKLATNTYFYVFDGGGTLLQSVRIHTSCSQPLNLDDQYGSLRLTGFVVNPALKDGSSDIEPNNGVPQLLNLYRPSPNPFTETTRFAYRIDGVWGARVDIGIYDVAGRRVRTLVDGIQNAGTFETSWDGTDSNGVRVRNGVYFLRSTVGDAVRSVRLVMLNR